MPSNMLMPELSPGMEKGNLVRWLKDEGDSFHVGDVLAEVETDKAIMEVPAELPGTLARIVVPAGTADVAVGQLIAVFAADGEAAVGNEDAAVSPSLGEKQPDHAVAHAPKVVAPKRNGRIFASPLARRIARDAGIALASIRGTGPGGRIIERDVRAIRAHPLSVAGATADSANEVRSIFSPGSYEATAHDNLRRMVASRLAHAVQTVPQFHITIDCEVDALLELRERINEVRASLVPPLPKVSLTDLILKAYAMAFCLVPAANVTWTETEMLRHKHVDVGLAVALPDHGLITPIVRSADAKTLSEIADETRFLVRRAKERKLKPKDYLGGTTSLSNLGMFGVREFTAIVNPPHATILAVGAPRQAVHIRDGQPVALSILAVTLTCDHRAVDGALGAELLSAFKRQIENPISLIA